MPMTDNSRSRLESETRDSSAIMTADGTQDDYDTMHGRKTNELMELIVLTSQKEKNGDGAYLQALEKVRSHVDQLVGYGLETYFELDHLRTDLGYLREELQDKEHEARRLRCSIQQNQTVIGRLTRAVESTKAGLKSHTRLLQSEGTLRAQLQHVKNERNEAVRAAAEAEGKREILQDKLSNHKTKLERSIAEMGKMEQEARTTVALAQSLGGGGMSREENPSRRDNEGYYKRKAQEMTTKLQSLSGEIAQQKQKIEDLQCRQQGRRITSNQKTLA